MPGYRIFQNMRLRKWQRQKRRFPPLQAALCGRRARAMRSSLPRCGPPLRQQPLVGSKQALQALFWASAAYEIRNGFERWYSSVGPYHSDLVNPHLTEAELEAEIAAILGAGIPAVVQCEGAACRKR